MKAMVLVRLAGGIHQHFRARCLEWIMGVALIGWHVALTLRPDTFETSQSFDLLASWGDEASWALACIVAACLRYGALAINGTFRERFRYAPHLRALAGLFAASLWGNICLSTIIACAFDGGSPTGIVAYGMFLWLELDNLFFAMADVTGERKAHHVRPDA